MDDRELIRRIQRGEKEYINAVAERYYDDIYRFCLYQSGSPEDASDLVQETFLKFIRYLDSYRYRNLKGYLLTIAMNLCRDYFRQPDRKRRADCPPEELERQKAPEEDRELGLSLREALGKLPHMQREAIVLLYVYGYRYREIAGMTGVTVSTVKSRVRQGTGKLRRILGEEDSHGQGY